VIALDWRDAESHVRKVFARAISGNFWVSDQARAFRGKVATLPLPAFAEASAGLLSSVRRSLGAGGWEGGGPMHILREFRLLSDVCTIASGKA
jgi:hypothetical protein